MVAGVRIELFLPTCQNLKEKRAIVKSILAQLRNKFNVSAAELACQDQWQRAILGVAAVANEVSFLQKQLEAAIRLVENSPGVELIHAETEYYD